MTKKGFVNLHLHTETGSPLDGFSSSQDIIKRCLDLNYDTIAITDHGSMSGILELYKEGKEKGVRVIPGVEAYCVDDRTKPHVKGTHNYHLILLAKNKEGYQNLLKLNFEAYKTPAKSYMRTIPRVDIELLKQYGRGIIGSSACLGGKIPQLLKEGKEDEAAELAETYKSIFDDFYLEVQPAYLIGEDQKQANLNIQKLSERTKIPMIVTLDSHYAHPNDRMLHQILLAIQSKKTIYDPDRLNFEATPLISEEDILADLNKYFEKDVSKQLIENTRIIANQCEKASYLESGKGYKIPKFPVPTNDKDFEAWKATRGDKQKDKTESQKYCRYKIDLGWKEKLSKTVKTEEAKTEYKTRLMEELSVIEDMNFSDYFLIVGDMLEECKKRGISRGAGRGSAGGSLLAYLMDITKVDPVKYDLLFSRFLNKDRISMPDIDSDICQSRRDEIKQYLIEKYGADKVAGIATFGTMKVRAAIKDIIRSLDLGKGKSDSFKLADKISKCIPDEAPPDISFEDAYKLYPEFKTHCDTQNWQGISLGKLLERFEGVTRQMGIHAAGVIISTEPLAETLPLIIQNDIVATAYDGPTLEKAGYLKLDILGLRTLDVIDDTVRNVKLAYNKEVKGFPLTSLDFDPKDPQGEQKFAATFKAEINETKKQAARAYRLYRTGQTSACFQVSGSGMQNLLRKVKPNNIEDIAAVLALFRPGPLGSGMTEQYAMRKTGKENFEYDHPDLKPILETTLGITCFQEQIMHMAMVIGGFTASEADTLRKACSKKNKELMNEQEIKFIQGGLKKGYSEELVNKLWLLILKFSEYGFNKCLSRDTLFQTSNGIMSLKDLMSNDQKKLYSVDFEGKVVENDIVEIFSTGMQDLYEIEFEDGIKEKCTMNHKFLCNDNEMHSVKEIIDNDYEVKRYKIQLDNMKIQATKYLGQEETFNLTMKAPYHNYKLASGIISANSHSVAYALTSYKQTFLKANYPSAFWAAALTHEPDEDKRNAYLTEIRQTLRKPKEQQIHVLAVDINESELEYRCVSPNAIRRNLLSLKGIGESVVEEIIKNRPYKDFQDFVTKIDSKKINARVLKVLINSGAFDSLSQNKFTRKFLYYTHEALRAAITKYKKKYSNLDEFTFDWDKAHSAAINEVLKENPKFEYGSPEWDAVQIRQDEEEIYGVAVSSHPFDDYPGMELQVQKDYATRYVTFDVDFERYEDRTPVVFLGILKTERKIDCKNGTVLHSYKVEDRYGAIELAVFENEHKLNPVAFKIGNVIIGHATVSRKYGTGKKLTLSGGRGRSGIIRVISKI